MPLSDGPLISAFRALQRSRISRREFMTRAVELGASLPLIQIALNTFGASDALAQDSASGRPTTGTEGQTRGAGGQLNILQWMGPAHANSHHALSTAELLASCLVQEPLLSYAPDGSLLANLVTEVPSIENGGLSADLRSVTYHLIDGLLWSDGEPVTAEDVRWTWQWITDETNASPTIDFYRQIESVAVISPAEVTITFTEPTLTWFFPFTSAYSGSLLPRHIWDGRDKDAVNQEFLTKPIGTGPYKIDSFDVGHQVSYSINENYREPNKPFFSSVVLLGGGDGATTAQAVLQDGNADLAWNVIADRQLLAGMEAGGKGVVGTSQNTLVEHIVFNFSDPNIEIDGERSNLNVPHPFLTDPVVREAMTLAIDRDKITENFLGADLEPVALNILTGIGALESPNTRYVFDIERANQLLDDAGWTWTGDFRLKEGTQLSVTYNTTDWPARARTQHVVQEGWESIGIQVQLAQLDPGQFFGDPANDPTNVQHAKFYCDVEMFSSGLTSPMPLDRVRSWYAGPENGNVAQKANDWQAANIQRYVNPDYDALYEEVVTTTDAARATELMIQMNDLVVNEHVVVPLITHVSELYAISTRLMHENLAANPWEPLYWNIANWRTIEG